MATHDFFDQLSENEVRRGLSDHQRDRMFQTYVRNQVRNNWEEGRNTNENIY